MAHIPNMPAMSKKVMAKTNREIEEELRKQARQEKTIIKLLLLGTAECGKSTILKQMRILHDSGFKEEEYEAQKHIICDNILESMTTLIEGMETLDLRYANENSEAEAKIVLDAKSGMSYSHRRGTAGIMATLNPQVVRAIKSLWTDSGVRQCAERGAEIQLNDSAQYFFDAIDRIVQPAYKPTQQDMLRSRVSTLGIVETRFHLKGMLFRVFDVGGQRTQRRKWIHCFDNVTAVIFLVALSEYDQKLKEDLTVNRMHESLALFRSIFNCVYFASKNFILFLNKRDLFAEKIRRVPLTVAFPQYRGPEQDYDRAVEFIAQTFENANEQPKAHSIYMHQTCGTDTNQVEIVLDSTLDTIIEQRMKSAGLA